MNFCPAPWIGSKNKPTQSQQKGFIFFIGSSSHSRQQTKKVLSPHLEEWQWNRLENTSSEVDFFTGSQGPLWIITPQPKKESSHEGFLQVSDFGAARDLAGSIVPKIREYSLDELETHFLNATAEQTKGLVCGLEIGQYTYLSAGKGLPRVSFKKGGRLISPSLIQKGARIGEAVNQTRHLVNLPANELNPVTYANAIKKLFQKSKTIQAEVWTESRLKKENMGLLLAVGQGSNSPPRMVRMSYRPRGAKGKPIAFVGKGITFDTGGLDIKPAAGMRLMKKDMGGSAVLVGLAKWLEHSGVKKPVDLYLTLAENSVDERSYRPGDVITARNGLKIEIDNTDAEGRLALADVLHVAATQKGKDEPAAIIDVATLTGAGKIALGRDVGALYSNTDGLSHQIQKAGQKAADPCWRMPLYTPYLQSLQSPFADFVNSGDGFGGSITAALFLQQFVENKKWAHLDIFAWNIAPQNALNEKGGSGQSVQCLIHYLGG